MDLGCGCGEAGPSGCDESCGSTLENDECGVCGGDGISCSGPPDEFQYNSSTLQAFYYFYTVTINSVVVDSNDWVGAFNGNICVGARQWDTSLCNNGVCDVPVMGYDNTILDLTAGYMETGDIPLFKIYDVSENLFYDAMPTENIPWSNLDLNIINNLNGSDHILGCMDATACNYDDNATIDDDSCEYAMGNYDCEGNCTTEIDCSGECGGSAVEDECGICDGDGSEDGYTCDGIPFDFVYNQSSLQAFYYIYEVNDINGDPLTADDWVATFNDNICVGARQWDTSLCNSSICDVPAMGDDGYSYSAGYLNEGDLPHFKIYDASEGQYFDVYPYPQNYAFISNMVFNIEELIFEFSYSIPLSQYNNLISFYTLPGDNTVTSVMLDIQDNITAVFGEAVSAQYSQDGDYWEGSLMNLDISSGYWLRVENADTLDGSGYPLYPDRIYDLHSGANLVSYPSTGSVGISAGLPDDIEDHVIAIIGQGFSAVNSDLGWDGSLMDFEGLHGYWLITDSDISFSYDLTTESLSRKSNPYKTAEKPKGFEYIQSTQQSFYFVDHIELVEGEIEEGDWLISYCDNRVAGTRQWLGRTVDIPVMGVEGNYETAGYCDTGDIPHIKLLKPSTQELISLNGDIPGWQSNNIFQLGTLKESLPLPDVFIMESAYPNPFNPTTAINFGVPVQSHVEVSVFDLRGQKIATLTDEFLQPGKYSVNWDAGHAASGIYFVHFIASDENTAYVSQIQKLMLVK